MYCTHALHAFVMLMNRSARFIYRLGAVWSASTPELLNTPLVDQPAVNGECVCCSVQNRYCAVGFFSFFYQSLFAEAKDC